MSKLSGLLLGVILFIEPCLAQEVTMSEKGGLVDGGIGITTIDAQSYFTISFRPEIALGKLGLGLDLRFLYHTKTGRIRSKDWNSGYDYSRLIRYVRYGQKGDRFYSKIGTLDRVRLGHGFIINYYTNEANYDERKIGMLLDLDLGRVGFESMTSNLGRAEILGMRAYYRPLHALSIPIIKNLTCGGTFVTDVDQDSYKDTKDAISIWGVDVELPLIDVSFFKAMIYSDYAKIRKYGYGTAVGAGVRLKNLGGILALDARLERRFLDKEFIPAYFDALYEIERYIPSGRGYGTRKEEWLPTIVESRKGIFGELYGLILGQIEIVGNFQRLDDQKQSGILHLQAVAPKAVAGLAFHATYDKKEIETLRDIRTLDARSVARIGVGYKIKPYLIFYLNYIWSFVLDEKDYLYKPQERFEPRLALNYPF